MTQREAWLKYKETEKGKATIKRHQQSPAFKETQRKYYTSEKFKQHRRDHPEIYKEPIFTNSVSRLLLIQEEQVKDDPESLTPEFICKVARIDLHKPPVGLKKPR
jgi:hypothetical protein